MSHLADAWAPAMLEIAATLPPLHKDPMDRMLIGTSRDHHLRHHFADYGVITVW